MNEVLDIPTWQARKFRPGDDITVFRAFCDAHKLSPRQQEALYWTMTLEDPTHQNVADKMGIKRSTIENQYVHITRKLGARTVTSALGMLCRFVIARHQKMTGEM